MRFAQAFTVLSLAAVSIAATPEAGPARLLKDINIAAGQETHAWPQGFVELPDVTVFIADDGVSGFELWRTDGTEAGTVRVKDIYPGPLSSVAARSNFSTANFVSARAGDVVFFPASDGVHGLELWRTDGSEAGTFLLSDIRPGPASGLDPVFNRDPFTFATAGGVLYFLASDASHGTELWRSDGTEAGTFLVKDIFPGTFGSNSFGRLESAGVGGALYFTAHDAVHGSELWRTDGTEAGTIRLTDLPINGAVGDLAADVGGALLFLATETTRDIELWRSDGTEAGTYRVKDIRPGPDGSNPFLRFVMNGAGYFIADDGLHGDELWKSDGTPEGTVLVKDIQAGTTNSVASVIGAFDGKLYFVANDGTHGHELWVTDGTESGTHLVKEIVPGPNTSLFPNSFTRVGAKLYFVVDDTQHGPEVWTTDGTEGGTALVTNLLATFGPFALTAAGERLFYTRGETARGVEPWATNGTDGGALLRDIFPGPRTSFSFLTPGKRGDTVLFGADDGVHGIELWSTDGTPGGTVLLKNVNARSRTAPSTELVGTVDLGGKLLFFADDASIGREPWITDGTEGGTRLVRDVLPGLSGSFQQGGGVDRVSRLGSSAKAVFSAFDGLHGTELWATDGTESGTYMVKDIRPGSVGSEPFHMAAVGSFTVFGADDGGASGHELWVTDGTEAGTHLVKDIYPGSGTSFPQDFVPFGDALYFFAYDGSPRPNLWRTDGTAAGTFRFAELGRGYTTPPVVYQGSLWFITGDSVHASELWRSDGTEAGTVHVGDLGTIEAYELTVAGESLFFFGYIEATGPELWITDGTIAGSHLVKETFPGEYGALPDELVAVGDKVFFVGVDVDDDYGYKLWKSDGTEAGTDVVKDILLGADYDGSPKRLTSVEGILLFIAQDGEHGLELWRSDGTEAGTFLVQDLLPGPEGSDPGAIVPFGNRLAFVATDAAAGREPWVARPSILTRQPFRAVQDLADQVRALGLPQGIELSLTAKLDSADAALARPNGTRVALRMLDLFAKEVEKRAPNPIPEAVASDLLDFVGEIEGLLGVNNGAPPSPPRVDRPWQDDRVVLDRLR
jgi:ELWxxDGT repeat protein